MNLRLFSLLCLAALLSACSSTPENRIEKNQSAFDQYPADVQQKIRRGQVEIGFTPEMVRLALGEPTRVATRKTDSGEVEAWIYIDSKPAVSFGIGFGTGGHHSGGGVGIATSTGGRDVDEKVRVEFRDGKVTGVEWSK
jgi:outer membrane protein assembly factor BamE (lipoprotein component of BamABCDE complex)